MCLRSFRAKKTEGSVGLGRYRPHGAIPILRIAHHINKGEMSPKLSFFEFLSVNKTFP